MIYFIQVAIGGPLFGFVMAKITLFWLSKIFNDALAEITITLASTYLTYYMGKYSNARIKRQFVTAYRVRNLGGGVQTTQELSRKNYVICCLCLILIGNLARYLVEITAGNYGNP